MIQFLLMDLQTILMSLKSIPFVTRGAERTNIIISIIYASRRHKITHNVNELRGMSGKVPRQHLARRMSCVTSSRPLSVRGPNSTIF